MLFEKFLEAFEHILGWTGVFPNSWGNRSLECSNPPVGFTTIGQVAKYVKSFVICQVLFARKAPDVAILQITGTVFRAVAGARGWMMEWLEQFLECMHLYMYVFLFLYLYTHANNVCREREEEKKYRDQFVVCSLQIKNRKPLKGLLEVGDWSS